MQAVNVAKDDWRLKTLNYRGWSRYIRQDEWMELSALTPPKRFNTRIGSLPKADAAG